MRTWKLISRNYAIVTAAALISYIAVYQISTYQITELIGHYAIIDIVTVYGSTLFVVGLVFIATVSLLTKYEIFKNGDK